LPFESRSYISLPSNWATDAQTFLKNWPIGLEVSTPSRTKMTPTFASRRIVSMSIMSATERAARSIEGKTTTSSLPARASVSIRSSVGRSRLYPETPSSRYIFAGLQPRYSTYRSTSLVWASRPNL
jgi:hypothetical protein